MQGLIDTTIQHYHIQRRLARGGMSEVYLAEDTRDARPVALKLVARDTEEYLERFRREVRAIASLNHDHILPALDYGEYRSWSYLVTPYIELGTLRDRLGNGPLSLKAAGLFLEQIADALEYAHERGILHRDIKASNILLHTNEHCYLADFGLAKTVSDDYSLTRTGFLIGTPEYLAPELVDDPASVQSDIYALGVILYEMLTGDVPFKGNTPVAIVRKHLNELPLAPSERNPLIPLSVDRVVLRALHKLPHYRFQSPREFAEAYQRALVEEAMVETTRVASLISLPTVQSPIPHPIPHPELVQDTPFDLAPETPAVVSFTHLPSEPVRSIGSRRRSPRWIWAILVVSLLVLLLAGGLLFLVFSAMHTRSLHPQPTPVSTSTPLKTTPTTLKSAPYSSFLKQPYDQNKEIYLIL